MLSPTGAIKGVEGIVAPGAAGERETKHPQ